MTSTVSAPAANSETWWRVASPEFGSTIMLYTGHSEEFIDYSLPNKHDDLSELKRNRPCGFAKNSNSQEIYRDFKSQFFHTSQTITDESRDSSAIRFVTKQREIWSPFTFYGCLWVAWSIIQSCYTFFFCLIVVWFLISAYTVHLSLIHI